MNHTDLNQPIQANFTNIVSIHDSGKEEEAATTKERARPGMSEV